MTIYIIVKPHMIAAGAVVGFVTVILMLSVAGGFINEYAVRCPPECTSGNHEEFAALVQTAKVLGRGSMKEVCLVSGAGISAAKIEGLTEDSDRVGFRCGGSVCSGPSPKLEVGGDRITARGKPVFDIEASCMQGIGTSECTLFVLDNKDWD